MSRTILLADDDAQIRRLCRITLVEGGYLVKEAANGKEALAAISETPVDLIVLDLSMPEMDGFEFLSAVHGRSPGLKIITISGFMGGAMLPAASLLGGTATLAKPFAPETLLALVDGMLPKVGPARPPA